MKFYRKLFQSTSPNSKMKSRSPKPAVTSEKKNGFKRWGRKAPGNLR